MKVAGGVFGFKLGIHCVAESAQVPNFLSCHIQCLYFLPVLFSFVRHCQGFEAVWVEDGKGVALLSEPRPCPATDLGPGVSHPLLRELSRDSFASLIAGNSWKFVCLENCLFFFNWKKRAVTLPVLHRWEQKIK